jgi:hypothetical protein
VDDQVHYWHEWRFAMCLHVSTVPLYLNMSVLQSSDLHVIGHQIHVMLHMSVFPFDPYLVYQQLYMLERGICLANVLLCFQ